LLFLQDQVKLSILLLAVAVVVVIEEMVPVEVELVVY
tara:strand:+ start:561 stop:671 length:111 start_codon:yes stop_codon:yes gene_type:complete